MGGHGGNSGISSGFSSSLVQETVYHGTNVSNITSFSTGGRESNGAIFFSASEDYAEEEAYEKSSRGGQQTMYEVKLNIQNPMEVTLTGNQFGDPTIERRYIQQAKATGHDSVIFHSNTGDPYLDDTFYAVFSPKQVKITGRRKI